MTFTHTTPNNIDPLFTQEPFRNVQKMPALFVIDRARHIATREINPAAAWIFTEPARATIKRDGTSITVTDDGKVFARRAVKKGKNAPAGFRLAEVDPITGHAFGVEPVEQSGFYKMFQEAVEPFYTPLTPGTFELVGPKINGNPENMPSHILLRHGAETAVEIPDMRNVRPEDAFDLLHEIFTDFKERGIEGVVWHGADNKRAKLRVKDFFGDPNRR